MYNFYITYTHTYEPAKYMPGAVSINEHSLVLTEFEWWQKNGDTLFKHIAKLQSELKNMKTLSTEDKQLMLALKMFYLSTKLATQIKTEDPDGFKKAIDRIVQAENRVLELLEP